MVRVARSHTLGVTSHPRQSSVLKPDGVRRPHIVSLGAIGDEPVGGKAQGLARLIRMGLPVPDGFVIVNAVPGALPSELASWYRALGSGPVAVRSSAIGEDSAEASFAGQYDTILSVVGEAALEEAVERCLSSLDAARADAYQQQIAAPGSDGHADPGLTHRMCVVVQRMVDARAAGVLFTADPVTARRAHVVIDAVRGLGEALVSGHASPDHYQMARDGRTLSSRRSEPASGPEVVTEAERRALVTAALAAEASLGIELDLEWAIDAAGAIHWLQARPITQLGADPNELDTPRPAEDHVYTRCNVGEMFPGVCTPLSFSFTARSIDVGMQRMQRAVGAVREIAPECRFIAMFHGHLFLDLTTMAETPHALGSGPEQLALSICGRPLDEVTIEPLPPLPLGRRLANGARYVRYLLGQRRARRELQRLREDLAAIDVREEQAAPRPSARVQWEAIDARFSAIYDAMDYHLISSAGSGVLSTTILSVVARGAPPTDVHHALAASLLAGAEGVESADIVAGAERVQHAIAAHPDADVQFVEASTEAARRWLEGPGAGDAGTAYRTYLARHGHRAVKELELRQPEWREDPTPLLKSLQAGTRQLRRGDAVSRETGEGTSPAAGFVVRALARLAHQAARSREETKSGLVDVTTAFKRAYRRLADALVSEQMLPDRDAIYFLTHAELGTLSRSPRVADAEVELPALARRAVARREMLPQQEELQFLDVFVGEAVPVREEVHSESEHGVVTGAPVSRGRVQGRARVVLSLEDAEALEPGEILIARVTDVGWTPYFSLIAGLVTDVGSAVSHGAVVAREYRLPAVVNTRFATKVFGTGDLVELDGEQGVVRRVVE